MQKRLYMRQKPLSRSNSMIRNWNFAIASITMICLLLPFSLLAQEAAQQPAPATPAQQPSAAPALPPGLAMPPPAEAPPEIQGGTPYPPPPPEQPSNMKLVELVINTPSLHTFLVTLKTANMGSFLQENGPFTVFAPDDAAFKRLPPGALRFLSGLNNRRRLVARIKYHIVPGIFLASNLTSGMELMTLEGQMVRVTIIGTDIYINNAKVVQTNMTGTNGVLHIIDRVLIPE